MGRTRREIILLAAASGLLPRRAHADPGETLIIALGETAERPAASRSGYLRAIQDGADYLETILTPSQDGALIACSERELSGFTDIAGRSEFAGRITTKPVRGAARTGWFVEDFTLAELQALVVAKPGSRGGHEPSSLLTLQDVVDMARAASVRTARVVGVYAGLVEPGYLASLELPLEPRLAEAIKAAGYNSPAAAMFVHASEPAALINLRNLCQARLVRRLEAADPAAADALSAEGLKDVRAYAYAIAPDAELLDAPSEPKDGPAFVARTRATGLALHAWAPVSRPHRRDYQDWLAGIIRKGVDGLATDVPQAASAARRAAERH